MHEGIGKSFFALLLGFAMLGSPLAGTLSNFEAAVAKPSRDKDRSRDEGRLYSSGECDDAPSLTDSCATSLLEVILSAAFYGTKWLVYDWWAEPDDALVESDSSTSLVVESPYVPAATDDPEYTFTDDELEGFKHRLGTPGMPYVRFDYRWQYLKPDLDAQDYLLEAGYKYAAVYGRITQYEGAAGESLDIEQYYGMVRFGGSDDFLFPGAFQIGAGLGWYVIKGDQIQEGPALTVPIILYPNDWVGFEFRPAWTAINDKSIADYDLSVSLGREFTHLHLGYRWLWVEHEGPWLKGPYAGISLSF